MYKKWFAYCTYIDKNINYITKNYMVSKYVIVQIQAAALPGYIQLW